MNGHIHVSFIEPQYGDVRSANHTFITIGIGTLIRDTEGAPIALRVVGEFNVNDRYAKYKINIWETIHGNFAVVVKDDSPGLTKPIFFMTAVDINVMNKGLLEKNSVIKGTGYAEFTSKFNDAPIDVSYRFDYRPYGIMLREVSFDIPYAALIETRDNIHNLVTNKLGKI